LAPALNEAIEWALRNGKFGGLAGLHSVRSQDGSVYVNPNGGDSPTINKATADEGDERLGVAAKVIIPVAAVTLFLLAILFLQRRRKETVTHVKDGGDDSLLDCETDEETTAERAARFVNEDDDLTLSTGPYDGMDDSYYEDSYLGKNQATMDVHICQSSLCEACQETDRHGGISFVKTGAPESPERLPRNATRNYSASDTVSL